MKYTIKMTIFSEAEMDFHLQQLVKLCRVCGKRLCKAKGRASVFQCTKFKEGLLMTLDGHLAKAALNSRRDSAGRKAARAVRVPQWQIGGSRKRV